MTRAKGKKIWVSVRIQRGFVTDIRAFEEKELAFRQERSWRHKMNPDYDETGVRRVSICTARPSALSRAKATVL